MRKDRQNGPDGDGEILPGISGDVRKYRRNLAVDALLLNQGFAGDSAVTGGMSPVPPVFLLGKDGLTSKLTNEEIARQILNREDSDLFR